MYFVGAFAKVLSPEIVERATLEHSIIQGTHYSFTNIKYRQKYVTRVKVLSLHSGKGRKKFSFQLSAFILDSRKVSKSVLTSKFPLCMFFFCLESDMHVIRKSIINH